MIVRSCVRGIALVAALLLAGSAMAQEPEAPPAADGVSEQPAKPKPRPKPKPKPKLAPKAEAAPAPAADPKLRTGAGEPLPPVPTEEPPAPVQSAFAAPPVACEPGQSVLYDGPKDFSVWVTRTGAVTIDNPLRPLTPDVTRVLQLVIGDKIATAYGRDITSLRRGASPAALEGLLGGPVRWDALLGTLPDAFEIVSDSGATLAQMRFKECGTAPAARALPPPGAKKDGKAKSVRKAPAPDGTGTPAPASLGRTAGPKPSAAPHRALPQGALSE